MHRTARHCWTAQAMAAESSESILVRGFVVAQCSESGRGAPVDEVGSHQGKAHDAVEPQKTLLGQWAGAHAPRFARLALTMIRRLVWGLGIFGLLLAPYVMTIGAFQLLYK